MHEFQGYLSRSLYGMSYTDKSVERFMKLDRIRQLRPHYHKTWFIKTSLNKSWAPGLTMWNKLDKSMEIDTKKRWYIPEKSKGLDLFPWKRRVDTEKNLE